MSRKIVTNSPSPGPGDSSLKHYVRIKVDERALSNPEYEQKVTGGALDVLE